MKSSEIEAIDYIISWIENVGATYDMEVSCYEEEFKKIKQDLEVLEILKKYLYLGGYDGDEDYPRDLRLEICDYSHLIDEVEEEYADYNKVKQWLEENE